MQSRHPKIQTVGYYGVGAALSTIAAVLLLQLWNADLHVPFDYLGDALFHAFLVKSVMDYGWFWNNPSVGAPGAFQFYDFPVAANDTVHFIVIKILSALSSDWPVVFNTYFLIGFPLITLSATLVFRHFGARWATAIGGAILYSFLPSRLLKGEGHLFLDVFYQVPLAILILLWTCGPEPPLMWEGGTRRFQVRQARLLAALAICALLASSSAYYAFFTCCLLVAGGIWASVERRRIDNALAGIALTGAVVLGLLANGLPVILYHFRHGPSHVAKRFTWEAEAYGMKIAALLLPTQGHRIPALRELKRQYETGAPLVGENASVSLGIVGAVGFLVLVGVVFSGRRPTCSPDNLLRPLGVLNLMAVLLGTIGGFGSIFALLVSPQIRTYSRLNVFIAFFSLFAIVLLLECLCRKRGRLGDVAVVVVVTLGLLDQATPAAIRPYALAGTKFRYDAEMVREIEGMVPSGSAIFQLPYMNFPEADPLYRMSSYDGLRPYLHSRALRWSFPVMRGRGGDAFVRDVSQREPKQIVQILASVGFGGVLVSRDGYSDKGSAIEAALRTVLAAEPVISKGGDLAFFPLTDYRRRMHLEPSPEELDVLLHPIEFAFGNGCYGIERGTNGTFRWCRTTGEFDVENSTSVPRRVVVRMTIAPAQPPAWLTLEGELISDRVELLGPIAFEREIDVSPGRHRIRFACDGRKADAPTDPRTMVWRIENFTFDEMPGPHRSGP